MRGRGRIWVYVLLFLLTTINYMDRVTLSVAAQSIVAEFQIPTVMLGYLFSSFIWTYFACLLLWGIALDRFGSRAVNTVGMTIFSCATIATGFAWSYASILVTRLVMGAGEASSFPAGGKIIREWIPASERGLAATVLTTGSYAGPAVGALFVAWVISMAGWRAGFIATGALGFIWLFFWLVWFRRPEDATFIGEEERARILAERDSGAKHDDIAKSGGGVQGLLRSPSMWGLFLTQGLASYTQFLFLTWLPSYLEVSKGMSVMKTGLFTAVPYFGAVVIAMGLGALSDWLLKGRNVKEGGRRTMVAATMLSSAVIFAVPWVQNEYLILLLITLSLSGVAACISLNIALLSDLLKNHDDIGRATGLLITGGSIFAILAPIVTGYVIAATGSYDWAFNIAGVLLIIGATVAMTMTRQPIDTSPGHSDDRADLRLAGRPAAYQSRRTT